MNEPVNDQNDHQVNTENKNNNDHIIKSVKHKSRPIIGPVILIIIGLVFLLNSLGVELPWNFVWPILIIVVGILMIFGRGFVGGGMITLLVIIIVFAVIISLLNTNFFEDLGINVDNFTAEKIDTTTKKLNIPLSDYDKVDEIDLDIDIGMGEYSLTSVEDEDNLFTSTGRYNYETFAPVLNKFYENKKLSLDYSTNDGISLFGFSNPISDYELNLGQPEIKTNFNFDIGTGTSNILLTNQQMENLKSNIGTGEMIIDFNGENLIPSSADVTVGTGRLKFSGLLNSNITNFAANVGTGKLDLVFNGTTTSNKFEVDLDLGTGSAKIQLPENIGFKIMSSVGTGKIEVNNKKIDDENDYQSDSYDTAETIIDFNFDIGTGAVYVDLQEN